MPDLDPTDQEAHGGSGPRENASRVWYVFHGAKLIRTIFGGLPIAIFVGRSKVDICFSTRHGKMWMLRGENILLNG